MLSLRPKTHCHSAHKLTTQPRKGAGRAAASFAGSLAQPAPPSALQHLRYRSVFISDLHLGTPQAQAESLLDFLQTVQQAAKRELPGGICNCAHLPTNLRVERRCKPRLCILWETSWTGGSSGATGAWPGA